MQTDLIAILRALPQKIPWRDIPEFELLDERVARVDVLYANIIGVNEGYVEWCPNDERSKEETLAWVWVVRPDLGNEIAAKACVALREVIFDYINEQETEEISSDNPMPTEISQLVDNFAEAAIKYHEAILQGKSRNANIQAKQIARLFRAITQEGENGRQALLALVDSENFAVALKAAVYSLKYSPERCKTVLERLAKEPDFFIGFRAEQTLQRWEEGTWQLE